MRRDVNIRRSRKIIHHLNCWNINIWLQRSALIITRTWYWYGQKRAPSGCSLHLRRQVLLLLLVLLEQVEHFVRVHHQGLVVLILALVEPGQISQELWSYNLILKESVFQMSCISLVSIQSQTLIPTPIILHMLMHFHAFSIPRRVWLKHFPKVSFPNGKSKKKLWELLHE